MTACLFVCLRRIPVLQAVLTTPSLPLTITPTTTTATTTTTTQVKHSPQPSLQTNEPIFPAQEEPASSSLSIFNPKRAPPPSSSPCSLSVTETKFTMGALDNYFHNKIEAMKLEILKGQAVLRRLEAQRNDYNSRVRLLREELGLLQQPGSYVGEVVKVMSTKKVLVKVHPEGKYGTFYPSNPASTFDLTLTECRLY